MVRALLVAFVLAGLVPLSTPARAQDDWGLRRGKRPAKQRLGKRRPGKAAPARPRAGETDPHRRMLPVLLERYRRAVERDPQGGFALRRMLEVHRELHGSIDALVEEYERRAREDADPFVAQMVLGHVHASAARNEEALQAFRAAAVARPTSPAPLLATAEIARATGDLASARRDLEAALERIDQRSRKGEVLRTLRELALEDDDLEAAKAVHARVVALTPDSIFVRLELGQELIQRGRHPEAVDVLREVLPAARGDARAALPVYKELAQAMLGAGRLDEALQNVRRALRVARAGSGLQGELWEMYAEIYRRREDIPSLIGELERIGRGAQVLVMLARLYDEVGDEEKALEAYRRVLRRNRRDLDTRLRVIQLLQRSGRLEEVTGEYRALVRVSPGEPRFVIELAEHLMSQGDRAGAFRLVQQAARRHGRDEAVLTALATLYAKWGEQDRATRLLQTLTRIAPNDPDHIIALGEQYDQAGDRDRAVQTWRRLLQVVPDRAEARATLADVYVDHAMLPEAVSLYREAVQLVPDDVRYSRGLASALERNREHALAAEEWKRVLELAGEDRTLRREARSRIVGIWKMERTLSRRLPGLRRQFEADPPDLEAGRFLGEAFLKLRRLADAVEALRRVIRAAPGDVETHLTLERVLVQQGEPSEAIEILKRLAELDPQHAREYYQRIAQYALATYQDDEAVEYASRAVQLDPQNAHAHVRLAELHRSRQEFDAAIEAYRRAVRLDDRLFPQFFELAQLLLVRGRSGEADALYRQVLRRAADDDLVVRAARESIQIHEAAGTLDELERELLPMALAQTRRPVYRRVLVELYASLSRALVENARRRTGAARDTAREELRRIGVRGLKPLLEALADPDPAQKRAAVGILGYLGNPNAAPALFAAAEADDDAVVASRALLAAVSVADARHLSRLRALARHDGGRIRAAALWGLARVGGRSDLPALRAGVSSSVDVERTLACDGLGRLGDASVVPVLTKVLREDASLTVRAAAAQALGRLGSPEAVDALVQILPLARGIAGRSVAMALGVAGDARAVGALARASFSGEPEKRTAAAWALVYLGGSRPAPGEVDTFALPHGQLEATFFVRALLEGLPAAPSAHPVLVRHEQALRNAVEATLSPNERDAYVLLEAMDQGATLTLAPFTDDLPARGVQRDDALAALDRVLDSVAPQVALLVRSEDAPTRTRAVSVLGKLGGPVALEALTAAVSRRDDSDRNEAALRLAVDALARTEDPAAAAPLIEALAASHRWSIRTAAAQALGRLRQPRAVGQLLDALRTDEYAFVRSAAAEALGQIGHARAVRGLARALSADAEPEVRAAAARALGRIDGPASRRALESARDRAPAVRRAIRDALRSESP